MLIIRSVNRARVSFDSSQGERVTGTIMKFKRKTVTVATDNGQRWNVSPYLLSAIKDVTRGKVVDLTPQKKE